MLGVGKEETWAIKAQRKRKKAEKRKEIIVSGWCWVTSSVQCEIKGFQRMIDWVEGIESAHCWSSYTFEMNKLENRLTGLSTRRKCLLKEFERPVHFLTELQRYKPVECSSWTKSGDSRSRKAAKPCFKVNNISGSLLRSVFLFLQEVARKITSNHPWQYQTYIQVIWDSSGY